MAKVTTVQIDQVFADCPDCGEPLLDYNDGSSAIKICEHSPQDWFACGSCLKRFQLPEEVYNQTLEF